MYLNNSFRQQNSKNNYIYQQPIPEFVSNPKKFLQALNFGFLRMLNELLKQSAFMPNIRFSQETIGKYAGNYCREYTNTGLRVLEDMGLIVSEYRHRKTKIYRVSAYFLIPGVRLMLAHLLPALAMAIHFQLTPIKSINYLYKNIRQSTSKRQSTKKENLATSNNHSSKKEKEREMNNSIDNRSAIDQVKNIKLTKWGKLRLQSFQSEAIKYADENFDFTTFNSFVAACRLYSQNNGLPIDWKLGYDLTRDMPKSDFFAEKPNRRSSILKQRSTTNSTNHQLAEEYDRNFPKRGNSNQVTKYKPWSATEEVISTPELEADLDKFTALKNARAFASTSSILGKSPEEYFNAAFQNRQEQYIPHMSNPIPSVARPPLPDVSWIVKAWLDDKEAEVRRYGLERFVHRLEAHIFAELHKAGRDDAKYQVIAEMKARYRYDQ